MANRYWVGDSGNSTDTAHWSTSDGGAGGASVPTSADNVFLTASSFSNTGSITITGTNFACLDFTCTTDDFVTLTIDTGRLMTIYGNASFGGSLYVTGSSLVFFSSDNGTRTIDWGTTDFNTPIFFQSDTGFTGTYNFTSDLNENFSQLIMTSANLNTQGYYVKTYSFDSTSQNRGTLTFDNSTFETRDFRAASGITTSAVDTVIYFNSSSGKSFLGGNHSYGTIKNRGTGNLTFLSGSNSNTFDVVDLGPNTITKFRISTTNTIGTLTTSSTAGNLAIIQSTTNGTSHTLTSASTVISGDYLNIRDSTATGTAAWYAGTHSTNTSNNSGWIFSDPPNYGSATIAGVGAMSATGEATFYISTTIDGLGTLTATGTSKFYPSIILTGTGTISAAGRLISALEGLERKDFVARVYDTTGTYLGEWNNEVITQFSYDQEINTAGSVIELELTRTLDNRISTSEVLGTEAGVTITTESSIDISSFGEAIEPFGAGTTIDLNLRVDIWAYYGYADYLNMQNGDTVDFENDDPIAIDVGAPNGRVMFTGFISDYNPKDGDNNTTRVKLTSFGDQLKDYIVETGTDTTVPYLSYDPSSILRSLLDKAQVLGLEANYTDVSVANTSTVVSYTYKLNTYKEAIDKVLELSPSDWYWWYDMGLNTIWLRPRPTEPDHTFIRGKHIVVLDIKKTLDTVVNSVYFKGGNKDLTGATDDYLFKKYEDTASITAYGRKLKVITDERVTNEDTADILAQSEIARYKDPRYVMTLIISANTYLIESIQLGQLVAIRGYDNFVDDLELQVLGLSYHPDYIVLQTGSLLPSINKRVADIKRNLDNMNLTPLPNAPTV